MKKIISAIVLTGVLVLGSAPLAANAADAPTCGGGSSAPSVPCTPEETAALLDTCRSNFADALGYLEDWQQQALAAQSQVQMLQDKVGRKKVRIARLRARLAAAKH